MRNLYIITTLLCGLAVNSANARQRLHSVVNDDAKAAAVDSYWTEERMQNATPMPLPDVGDDKFRRLMENVTPNPRTPKILEEAEAILTPGVPEKANVGERPFWNGGVLFFTKPGGGNYQCTAEFMGGSNILLTAAHCVRDGSTGVYYTNCSFRRAYSNGGGQSVGWQCAMVYYMWASPPLNYKYDYAFIHTNTTSGAGWLGMKTGIPYVNWTAIGYPKNYGSNKYMYEVEGSKGPISGGIVQMNDNPMNFGASGGAWIAELTTPHVGGNYAVGLNSFIRSTDPGKMWGPLFDNQFFSLYQKTVNNCTE